MQLSLQKVQTGTETKVSTPYDVASHLAYSKGFKTLKEYTDYVVANNMVGFLPDPTKYQQYTTAWNFLGTSRTQYYANRAQILLSKRDQEAVNRKTRETRARNKSEPEVPHGSFSLIYLFSVSQETTSLNVSAIKTGLWLSKRSFEWTP